MKSNRFLSALSVFLLSFAGIEAAVALEWEAALTVGEIYTDNVELKPADQAKDEWITRVSPSVGVSHEGKRLELDIDYSLEGLFYADVSARNEVYSQLESLALIDLIGDELRLGAKGGISQVNVNPDLPLTGSNINTTGNRTDAVRWDVGPEWKQTVFGVAEVDAFYRLGSIDYKDAQTQDVESRSGSFVLRNNPESISTFTYEASYTNRQLTYDFSPDANIQAAYLQLGYRFLSDFRVTVLGGADSDFTDLSNSSLSESRWEVGLDAELNDNVISMGVGNRFFGNTYRFSWSRDRDDQTLRISYREDPTNSDFLFLQVDVPEEGAPLPPDGELGRPGQGNRFVFKRADAGAQWRLFRSTLDISVFWERRENLTPTDGTGQPDQATGDEESFGAVVEFSWELGVNTIANLSGSWRNREVVRFDVAPGEPNAIGQDDILSASAGLSYRLGRKTSLSFDARFDSRDGNLSSFGKYDQFLATLEITRKL